MMLVVAGKEDEAVGRVDTEGLALPCRFIK